MKYRYLNLNISARRRFAILEVDAENFNKKYPPLAGREAKTWRDMRYATFTSPLGLGQGTDEGQPIWYTHDGQFFENETWCDEVEDVRIDHTGWFTDDYQDGKMRGFVAKLPHNRWLSGYWMSDNDERVYFPTVYDNPQDAARDADSEAERNAEEEREYNQHQNEGRELHEEMEELKGRIQELLALRNLPKFRDNAREELHEKLDKLRDKRQKMKADYSNVEI